MGVIHKVEHNLKNLIFFIRTGQNENSVLEYKKLSNSVIEMYHTEVPIQDRNKGFAEKMVKEAFKYCRENNYKVLPTCSYVVKYAREMASEEDKQIVVKN